MALSDFLDTLGYEAGGGSIPSINRSKDADFFGLYGDERLAAFLRQQEQGGFLSPESVNPFIRQLVEGNVASEAFRQENLTRSLAEAGVSPALAQAIVSEDSYRTQAATSAAVAGFESERQAREFSAGEDLIGLSSQIESEVTARAENQRRYDEAVKEAKKNRLISTILGVAGLGVSALGPGFLGGLFGIGAAANASGATDPATGLNPEELQSAYGGFAPGSVPPAGAYQSNLFQAGARPGTGGGFFPSVSGSPTPPASGLGFFPSGYGGYAPTKAPAPSYGGGYSGGYQPFLPPVLFGNPALPYLLGQYGGYGSY